MITATLLVCGASGYTWTEEVLCERAVYGADIGYSPGGTLQVVYSDQMSDLRFAENAGSGWTQTTIDGDAAARAVSLATAPNGSIGITYFGPAFGNTKARYAWNSGNGWQTEMIDTYFSAYNPISLAYNSTSVPWAVTGTSSGKPQVVVRSGPASWSSELPDPDAAGTQYSAASAVMTDRGIGVAYFGDNDLKFATRAGDEWTYTTVDGSSGFTNHSFCSAAVNPVSGKPAIAYCDAGTGDVYYAWYEDVWSTETVVSGGDPGSDGVALAFSPSGMPALIYLDRTNQRMMYAEKSDAWSTEQIAGPPDTYNKEYYNNIQDTFSLAFSPSGVPVAAYYGSDFVVATDGPGDTGSVSVTSSPSGAAIMIDGSVTGQETPYTFNGIAVGAHTVSVSLAGYGTETDPAVAVEKDVTTNISFTLAPVPPGSLAVTSSPSGAAITLDGVETQQITPYTFADLPAGMHTVNLTLDGYYPDGDSVDVLSETTTPVSFTLTPLPSGDIRVTTIPVQGAAIYQNGQPTGKVTDAILPGLSPGTYAIEVRLPGWETAVNSSVVVVDGETTEVAFILAECPFDWNIEIVADASAEGHQFPGPTSLGLNGGSATIGYYDRTDGSLRAARQRENGWTKYLVDGSDTEITAGDNDGISIAIDPGTGLPAIAYSYSRTGVGTTPIRYATFLRYAIFNGTGWEHEVADDQGYWMHTGVTPSLAFLNSSSPVIAYSLIGYPEHGMAATKNATGWVVKQFDVLKPDGYAPISLQHESVAVDAAGTACISIGDIEGVYFIRYVPEEAPKISCIEEAYSFDSSIDVAPDGMIGIAYSNNMTSKMNIRYAWSTDGGVTWDIETAVGGDDEADIQGPISFAFNSESEPALAYQRGASQASELRYGWRDAGVWKTATVDSGGDVGRYPSLQFSGTSPAISYINYTALDVMYASVSATTTSERVLASGWNMYSVPIKNPEMNLPGQVSPTAYRYDPASGGYESLSPEYVQPGFGYWFAATGPGKVSAEGVPLSEEFLSLSAGWNMIGCINSPVAVSALETAPAGAIQGMVYDYNGISYTGVSTLLPGHAYWVAASEDCTLTMTA